MPEDLTQAGTSALEASSVSRLCQLRAELDRKENERIQLLMENVNLLSSFVRTAKRESPYQNTPEITSLFQELVSASREAREALIAQMEKLKGTLAKDDGASQVAAAP